MNEEKEIDSIIVVSKTNEERIKLLEFLASNKYDFELLGEY